MSATMYELPVEAWLEYFAAIGFAPDGALVSVAVLRSGSAGRAAAWRLKAIDYDPDARELEIVADGLNGAEATLHYFIAAPRSIKVAQSEGAGEILVEDAGGIRTLIRLFHVPHRVAHRRDGSQAARVTSRSGNGGRYW